jgi:hypothetical protein
VGRATPRRLLLGTAWAASTVLTAYGGLLVTVGALVLTELISASGPVDQTALRWHIGKRQQPLPQRMLAPARDGVGAAAAGGPPGGAQLLVGQGGQRDRLHRGAFGAGGFMRPAAGRR